MKFLLFIPVIILIPIIFFVLIQNDPREVSVDLKEKYNFEFNEKEVVEQGRVKLITYPFIANKDDKLFCKNKEHYFSQIENHIFFFISASYNSFGSYNCTLNNKHILSVSIKDYDFGEVRKLLFPKLFSKLSQKEVDKSLADQQTLSNAYKTSTNNFLFNKIDNPYKDKKVLSIFGEIREFTNGHLARHNAIDYETRVGDEITAIADGNVVLAEDLLYCGKTIIIDHGLDFFSLYCHLNKLLVSKNDNVKFGQHIADAGNTGFSTAPHLHFGIRHAKNWIDPDYFINYSKTIPNELFYTK